MILELIHANICERLSRSFVSKCLRFGYLFEKEVIWSCKKRVWK